MKNAVAHRATAEQTAIMTVSATPDSDEVSWRSDKDASMEDDTVVVSAG